MRLAVPRPAYRVVSGSEALFNFLARHPLSGLVEISILDAQGAVVRNLPPFEAAPGLNRVAWDLRYEPPVLVALRTTPKENPMIWGELRFQGMQTRPVLHKGNREQAQLRRPLAAPGTYTVRPARRWGRSTRKSSRFSKRPTVTGSGRGLASVGSLAAQSA